ncbi:ragulator complex protein LAMTOR [Acrasis kona]|uniref:Ragulator complex protein LAMTOR n=1 Tax=Acrasis kona TaxID=1008807 RepID=A0AAW2YJ73_9EUKA
MLQPRVLPKVLEQANTDGVKTTLLMNINGSLLSSAGNEDKQNEKLVGAIISNIWTSYRKVGEAAFNPNFKQSKVNMNQSQEYDDEYEGDARDVEEQDENAEKLQCMILELGTRRVAVMGVSKRVVLCLIADKTVELGMLKAKATWVCDYLIKPFEMIEDVDDL